jgi:hypothetical protein
MSIRHQYTKYYQSHNLVVAGLLTTVTLSPHSTIPRTPCQLASHVIYLGAGSSATRGSRFTNSPLLFRLSPPGPTEGDAHGARRDIRIIWQDCCYRSPRDTADMACATCRARKIKCDRTLPTCKNCRLHASHCTYVGERRKRRRLNDASLDRGPSLVEDVCRFADTGDLHPRGLDNACTITQERVVPPERSDGYLRSQRPEKQEAMSLRDVIDHDGFQSRALLELNANVGASEIASDASFHAALRAAEDDHAATLLDNILAGSDTDCLKDSNPAVWMRLDDGDEYTGPSSGLSTISHLGLKWICDHVANSAALCSTIQDIRSGVLSHLRRPKCLPPGPWLGPDTSVALKPISPAIIDKYVDAYFSTVQTIFPVLDRAKFESQLAISGSEPTGQTDSWMALLNAVLASGCRAALSDDTANAFQESGREAWAYFRNALYYEAKLIHAATDLMAVQALAVMTVFAQGMSSPQRMEYTLSSTAARLAQSLALNRQVPAAWKLTEDEQCERNRLFWVIYCLDKTIGLRCGRPSVIRDDEISCCFPRGIQMVQTGDSEPERAGLPFDFFLCFTKLARICGITAQRLYSAAAQCLSSSQLLATANRILEDLESWRQSIPVALRPGQPFGRIHAADGFSRAQLLVLHFSYNYVLCAVHRRFTPIFTQDDEDQELVVLRATPVTHIEAARSMVLLTKYLDCESYSPAWYVPDLSHPNLSIDGYT